MNARPTKEWTRPLRLHYSSVKPGWVWQKMELEDGHTLEIFGDPGNACYEWLLRDEGGKVIKHSDCGYGIPAIALRDGLINYYGAPNRTPIAVSA